MRITLPESLTSPISLVTLFSSSPRSLAPAMMSPTSSCMMRLLCRNSGRGVPSRFMRCTMAYARPSAMAVLPTPGSPSRMGLFLVRRARIWVTRDTSRSRPITGSMRLARTSAHRSLQYSSSILGPSFSPPRFFLGCSASASPFRRLCASAFRSSQSMPRLSKTLRPDDSGMLSMARSMCSGEMKLTPDLLHSLVAASNVRLTSRLKGMLFSVLDKGRFLPNSDSTAVFARSAVNPELRYPFLLMVSSEMSPSRMCSVLTSLAPRSLASCCEIMTLLILRSVNFSNTAATRNALRPRAAVSDCLLVRFGMHGAVSARTRRTWGLELAGSARTALRPPIRTPQTMLP
mmetsp:Transcript_10026/g.21447  ORF Transcript_10026/g.21447 Transcript_10026/m.21447 type:complete len:346 (-) Transcript_10026:205-1242(-)